jgi:hypothetical protein
VRSRRRRCGPTAAAKTLPHDAEGDVEAAALTAREAAHPGTALVRETDQRDQRLGVTWPPVAFEDLDGRRLAGTVGTEKGNHLPEPDVQSTPSTAAWPR